MLRASLRPPGLMMMAQRRVTSITFASAPLVLVSSTDRHCQPRRRSPATTATTAAPMPRRRRRRPAVPAAAIAADVAEGAAAGAGALPAAAAVAVVAVLGLGGFRAALYSTLEYAKAAALARFVPKGAATPSSRGAKVVLLGAAPRDIYYLPKDTLTAVVIGKDVNAGLFDQAGVSAGVPTTGKRLSPGEQPWGGPDGVAAAGSLDAVVALGSALGKMPRAERVRCLREAVRALRPGRPLVLLQALEEEGGSPLRALVGPGGGSGAVPASELEKDLEEAGFAYVEWGVELQGTDPHALGVAVSPREGGGGGGGGDDKSSAKRRRREGAPADKAKGF